MLSGLVLREEDPILYQTYANLILAQGYTAQIIDDLMEKEIGEAQNQLPSILTAPVGAPVSALLYNVDLFRTIFGLYNETLPTTLAGQCGGFPPH